MAGLTPIHRLDDLRGEDLNELLRITLYQYSLPHFDRMMPLAPSFQSPRRRTWLNLNACAIYTMTVSFRSIVTQ